MGSNNLRTTSFGGDSSDGFVAYDFWRRRDRPIVASRRPVIHGTIRVLGSLASLEIHSAELKLIEIKEVVLQDRICESPKGVPGTE